MVQMNDRMGWSMGRPRLQSLQAIRGIAFVLIFLSHVELIGTGPAGVSLFLMLSGFCMIYTYIDKPQKIPEKGVMECICFSFNKIRKLYPLHLCTLLFVASIETIQLVLHYGFAVKEMAKQGFYFAANFFLVQSWIPCEDGYFSFNAVSWYLSTAAFTYFMFPLLYKNIIRKKSKKEIVLTAVIILSLMVVISALLGIGQRIFDWNDDFLKWAAYISPAYRLGDFAMGAVSACFFLLNNDFKKRYIYTIIETGVLLLLFIQIMIYNNGLHTLNWMLSLFWLPSSLILIYVFARNRGYISRLLSKCRFFVWIGNLSGEAFLIHQIVIKAGETIIDNKIILTVITLGLTILGVYIWKILYKNICSI